MNLKLFLSNFLSPHPIWYLHDVYYFESKLVHKILKSYKVKYRESKVYSGRTATEWNIHRYDRNWMLRLYEKCTVI